MTIEAEAQEPNTPAAAGDDALVAELDAMLASATPAAAEQPAEPAKAPEPPAVPDDEEERLLARARERQALRRQQEPLEAVQRELTELKAQLARAPGISAISQAVAAGDPAALGAALRAAGLDPAKVQQLATKAQLGPTPGDQIRQAVREELAPVLETLKPKQAPEAVEAVDREELFDSYVGYIEGAAERFPLQASLGDYAPHAAIAWIQRKFYAGGADPETIREVSSLTHEQVAVMFERELTRQRDARAKPSGAPTIASGEQQIQPPGAPSTASGGPTKTTSAPRSITAGHAATAARSTPRNAREVDEALARELEEMKRAM